MDRRSFLATLALAACARAGRSKIRVASAFVRRDRVELDGPPDRFEVASLSKPVFAYLVHRAGVDLDAPLAELAPPPYRHVRRDGTDDFADPRLARLTPRLLLAHRGGLPNWSRREPLAFVDEPGGAWRYSGEGYVLLQRALEAARGKPLAELAQQLVFLPLGMRESSFPADAASSLVSTAGDLARLVSVLFDEAWMFTRQVGVDAERRLAWGTGIGLAEPDYFFHWGANPGWRSLLVGSPRRGEAVVVLTDSDAGMPLAAERVRQRFGELPLLGFPMLYPPD